MINIFFQIFKEIDITIMLWVGVMLLAIPMALVIVFITWIGPNFISRVVDVYTWVIRGTPLLLQLFFIYYGLPMVGITFSAMTSALIAFTFNYFAYFIVIFNNAFFSVSKGQIDAGLALGFTKTQLFIDILLPQAFRHAYGALSSEAINLIKDSALLSTIGVADILRTSKEIMSREFIIMPFFFALIIYLMLSAVVVFLFKFLKKVYLDKPYA